MAQSILGNQSITIPAGNTSERPGTSNGQLRYNSQTDKVEVTTGSEWVSVLTAGSVKFGVLHVKEDRDNGDLVINYLSDNDADLDITDKNDTVIIDNVSTQYSIDQSTGKLKVTF